MEFHRMLHSQQHGKSRYVLLEMAHTLSLCLNSLHDLCLCKLIEKFDQYSPEMLSILPPVQRKELLLHCPVVSICHLEQICAFNGIDSDMKFSRIRLRCMEIIVVVTSMLMKSYYMHRNIKFLFHQIMRSILHF